MQVDEKIVVDMSEKSSKKDLLEELKENDINTEVETNLEKPREQLDVSEILKDKEEKQDEKLDEEQKNEENIEEPQQTLTQKCMNKLKGVQFAKVKNYLNVQDKKDICLGLFLGFFLNIFSLLLRKKVIKTENGETARKIGIVLSTIFIACYAITTLSYNNYILDKEQKALRNGKLYFRAYSYNEFITESLKQFVFGGNLELNLKDQKRAEKRRLYRIKKGIKVQVIIIGKFEKKQ